MRFFWHRAELRQLATNRLGRGGPFGLPKWLWQSRRLFWGRRDFFGVVAPFFYAPKKPKKSGRDCRFGGTLHRADKHSKIIASTERQPYEESDWEMQPRNTALSIKFLLAALLVWLPTQIVAAEPGRVSIRQPEFLEQYAVTNRFSNGRAAGMEITRAGDAVLFLRSGPRSFQRDLYEFDVATGAERVLLTSAQILGGAKENLTDEEKARRERMRLTARGITSFQISHDDHTLLLPLSGKLYLVDRKTAAVRQL